MFHHNNNTTANKWLSLQLLLTLLVVIVNVKFLKKSEVTGQLALVNSSPQSYVHRNQTSLLANDCLIIIYRR